MKTFVMTCLCLAIGCSGAKDTDKKTADAKTDAPPSSRYYDWQNPPPDSPEVKDFKTAARKFLADCHICCNAAERRASKEEMKRHNMKAMDAFAAIPNIENGSAKLLVSDMQILRVSLDILETSVGLGSSDASSVRPMLKEFETRVDYIKEKK